MHIKIPKIVFRSLSNQLDLDFNILSVPSLLNLFWFEFVSQKSQNIFIVVVLVVPVRFKGINEKFIPLPFRIPSKTMMIIM